MYGDDFEFILPRDVKLCGQVMRCEREDSDIVDKILDTAWGVWMSRRSGILWYLALDLAQVCGVKLQWVDAMDDDYVPDFEEENEE